MALRARADLFPGLLILFSDNKWDFFKVVWAHRKAVYRHRTERYTSVIHWFYTVLIVFVDPFLNNVTLHYVVGINAAYTTGEV